MISGGSEASVNEAAVGGFNALRALSTRNENPERASRPFDLNRDGLVLVDKKFVVSLIDNNWRVLNKNTWYKHKDIKHFVSNYIRKDTA